MIALRMVRYGLGNQLFAYTYARFCAEMTGEKIIVCFPKKMGHGCSFETGFGQSRLILNKVNILQLTMLSKGKNLIHKFIMTKQFIRTGHKSVNLNVERLRENELSKHKLFINYNVGNSADRYMKPEKDMYIQGYFQFPYYAHYMREALLCELVLSSEKTDKYSEIIRLMSEQNSVSVHIRRGDYLFNDRFPVYGEEYLSKALKHITALVEKPYFFLFAEDASYVNSIKHLFNGYNMFYVSEHVNGKSKDYDELCLMGYCRHFIISNSTYSWWGQFLGRFPQKIVISPKKWYQKGDMKTMLIEDKWIKIS